jgi:hypothetical protein
LVDGLRQDVPNPADGRNGKSTVYLHRQKSVDICSGEVCQSFATEVRNNVVFRDRPVTNYGARDHLVPKNIIMPMGEQLRHGHSRIRRWQPIVKISLQFFEFANHLGPSLRGYSFSDYASGAVLSESNYTEPTSIRRSLVN